MSNSFLHTLLRLGPGRLISMTLVTVGLIAFFSFFATRLAAPQMSLLYSELSLEDSGQIVSRLEAQDIPYRLQANGTQVLVPKNQVQKIRITMAADGIPAGGSVGYEIFDESDRLGTTSFVQQLNQVRALEGELARTISAIAQIQSARVHLVLPKREIFSRETIEASASIVLKLRGAALHNEQVGAIQNLIAGAVPSLSPNRISIVDSRGNLLAKGTDADGDDTASLVNSEEAQLRYERRLTETVERLLEQSVGVGRVRAEVAAEVDFDRLTTTDEIYDPDGQVVRSTQLLEEDENNSESAQADAVTIGNSLPNQDVSGEGGARSASQNTRSEETVNYEISRTVRTLVREGGAVRRLSVAVLIDGTVDESGQYQPRAEAEMEQYVALVKSAIGYDTERGDTVEVVNLRFAEEEELPVEEFPAPGMFDLIIADIPRIVEVAVLAIIAILAILLVVRPLVMHAFPTPIRIRIGPDGNKLLPDHTGGTTPEGSGQLPGPGDDVLSSDQTHLATAQGNKTALESQIDINAVEGAVRASSLKRIGEIVEQHPQETVQLVRQWMAQGQGQGT